MDKRTRVDMSQLEVACEDVPPAYEKLGGRALIAKILLTEIDPTCEPLGPGNKLIFAPGLLAGLPSLTSTGRLSVGGKSPLTQGIKEANAGGMAGDKLGHLGLKAIVVERQPTDYRLYLLHVTPQGAHLLRGGRYDGPYRTPS